MPRPSRTRPKQPRPERVTLVIEVIQASPAYSYSMNDYKQLYGPSDLIERLSIAVKGRILLPKAYEDEIEIHFYPNAYIDKLVSNALTPPEAPTCVGVINLRRSKTRSYQFQDVSLQGFMFMQLILATSKNRYLIFDLEKEKQKNFRVLGVRLETDIDISEYE